MPHSKTTFSGFLNKRSRYRKKWRRRYFVIADGVMKYYVATDKQNEDIGTSLKGIFDLTGARVHCSEESENMLEIMLPHQDHGNEIVLEAPTSESFQQLYDAVADSVNIRNVAALSNGSRQPEVVEWYYQQQSEFYQQMQALETETKFVLQYPQAGGSSSSGGASVQSHSTVVKVVVNKDQSGLLIRVDTSGQPSKGRSTRHLSRLEAMTDGRVVLFREMSKVQWRCNEDTSKDTDNNDDSDGRDRGVSNASSMSEYDEDPTSASYVMSGASTLVMGMNSLNPVTVMGSRSPTKGHAMPSQSPEFGHHPTNEILISTPEDQISLTQLLPPPGQTGSPQPSLERMRAWYEAVKNAISFVAVPTPTSTNRAVNAGSRASSSAAAVHYGFYSMNSGLVFACAGDVAVLLKSFDIYSRNIPAITQFAALATDIFKLIPDVQCNKEGASNFGERLEDVVRVMGDGKSGVMSHLSVSDSEEANEQIRDLCEELQVAKRFLRSLTAVGWLRFVMQAPRQTIANALKNKMSGKKAPKSQVRIVFEKLDADITAISNQLVKRYGDASWVFKKKAYDMVVDVGQCIEALGGIDVINSDSAKVRALARLIQADGSELQREIFDLVDATEGRERPKEGCGLLLRTLCCSCCWCCTGSEDRYKVARSRQGPKHKSSGNLDMSLLSNDYGNRIPTRQKKPQDQSMQHTHQQQQQVENGRDLQMMSIDSDFGEVPSSRFGAQHSYFDEDSTSNASSAGEDVRAASNALETSIASHAHHHRIITPERSTKPPGGNKTPPPSRMS